MKCVGKILSVCTLLVVAVGCYGAEEEAVKGIEIQQDIYILNKSKSTIRGGVYPTSATGKVLNNQSEKVQTMSQSMAPKACRVITIIKPIEKRATQYHRLIFAKDIKTESGEDITAEDAMRAKVNQDDGKHVTSSVIKQFSGDKDLYYEVSDDVALISGKPKLKIKKVGSFGCSKQKEIVGRLAGKAQEARKKITKAVTKASQKASEAVERASEMLPEY